jgi:hypothetical protein
MAKGYENFFIELVKMRPGFNFRGLTIDYTGVENYYNRIVPYNTIPVNKWTHIACTYSKNNQLITIYGNEEIKNQCTSGGSINSSTLDLHIGARLSAVYSEYFKGSTDEVSLWNIV